jgi:hypothetical protein
VKRRIPFLALCLLIGYLTWSWLESERMFLEACSSGFCTAENAHKIHGED